MNLPVLIRQFRNVTLLSARNYELANSYPCAQCPKSLYLTSKRWKADDRRELIKSMPIKDMGTQGEKQLDVDLINVR